MIYDCDYCIYFTNCRMQCEEDEMNEIRREIQDDIEEN